MLGSLAGDFTVVCVFRPQVQVGYARAPPPPVLLRASRVCKDTA